MIYQRNLYSRTKDFSLITFNVCRYIPQNSLTKIYILQVLRSSSSVCANYIEANNALSFKDCLNHLKVARKEARESLYWLEILYEITQIASLKALVQEAKELTFILSAMIKNKKDISGEF
jgi:four helix bundle protein